MRPSIAACLLALSLLLLASGCTAAPATMEAAPVKPPVAPAAEKPTAPKSNVEKATARPAKRERAPAQRAKVAQLFQVPQVTPGSGAGYADVRQDGNATPVIDLLGFSRFDGQLRALVRVRGETLPIEQGDVIDGVEVVAVDADGVSFQYAGQRWTRKLFEKLERRPVVIARASQSSPPIDAASPPSVPSSGPDGGASAGAQPPKDSDQS